MNPNTWPIDVATHLRLYADKSPEEFDKKAADIYSSGGVMNYAIVV